MRRGSTPAGGGCPLKEPRHLTCLFLCPPSVSSLSRSPFLCTELDSEDAPPCCRLALGEPPPYGAAPIGIPRPPPPRPGMHSPPPRPAPSPGTWESQPARSVRLGGPGGSSGGAGGGRVLECPSIRITSISPTPHPPAALEDNPDPWGGRLPQGLPPTRRLWRLPRGRGPGRGPILQSEPGQQQPVLLELLLGCLG